MYHQASYQICTGEVKSRSWVLTIPLKLEMRDYVNLPVNSYSDILSWAQGSLLHNVLGTAARIFGGRASRKIAKSANYLRQFSASVRMGWTLLTLNIIFMKFDIWEDFSKICRALSSSIKIGEK